MNNIELNFFFSNLLKHNQWPPFIILFVYTFRFGYCEWIGTPYGLSVTLYMCYFFSFVQHIPSFCTWKPYKYDDKEKQNKKGFRRISHRISSLIESTLLKVIEFVQKVASQEKKKKTHQPSPRCACKLVSCILRSQILLMNYN